MSPPRRRSARLASATPKPKASLGLDSLAERDESPSKSVAQSTEATLLSPQPVPTTPKSSAIKPPHEEMHPSHVHRSTADEPSSALRLGFTDIKNPNSPRTAAQMTPSKVALPPTQFNFQLSRQVVAESQLSDEAQRMMEELREKASRFKAELVAQREADANIGERKIAKPKGKSGRFSAAHMAEFKKMDSIEGHASAWRAQDGRFTPVVQELKRSPSKTNLDGTARGLKRSPSKANLDVPTVTPIKHSLKRTISKANLHDSAEPTPVDKTPLGTTPRKTAPIRDLGAPVSAAKRVKKREHDDATSSRPVSRDGSSLPRPKANGVEAPSNLSRLMSPTKASAAHSACTNKPTITLVKSTSSSNLRAIDPPSTTITAASPSRTAELKRRIISPGRLQRVTSLLRRNKTEGENTNTAIPGPTAYAAQTPNPPRVDKSLPPVPLTTPRRKLTKHVSFTPETFGKSPGQETPSPKKSMPSKFGSWREKGPVHYPALDSILKKSTSDEISYPDLSTFKSPLQEIKPPAGASGLESTPGRFTFRSDHTIKFGGAPAKGFGASAGQASVRHVRGSIMPTVNMPGNFPEPSSPTSNKENKEPEEPLLKITGVPHGMTNKKRHRPTWNEEEAEEEEAKRAAKKRKNEHAPEGQAVVAPRLAVATPSRSVKKLQAIRSVSRTPGSPSPTKRNGGLSLSRLNMLARPKNRV
ncbi:hypothetical protein NLU13_2760 [Sarocladium strictum]|uniref:Erythromycin esterase n=1 Tax=Sarocladium strictum TaxID=5046 RepID=A0AA39GKR2_SARSR|nr:hypothetical protein NLU13_2760 [Sarocladium strictum]